MLGLRSWRTALAACAASCVLGCQGGEDATLIEADVYEAAAREPRAIPSSDEAGEGLGADERSAAPSPQPREERSEGALLGPPGSGPESLAPESDLDVARGAPPEETDVVAGDAGAPEPEGLPSFAAPCLYRVEWQDIELSSPECDWFGDAALSASAAHWDGQSLSWGSSGASFSGGELSRMLSCPLGPASYRFHERLELSELPSPSGCTAPLTASYEYEECAFLNGRSGVCSREPRSAANEKYLPEGNVCRIRARAKLIPFAEAADAGALPSAQPACVPFASPDGFVNEPVPIGGACVATAHCEAGAYCSLLKSDLSCARPGTCVPAPSIDECSDAAEAVPTCSGGCQRTLPLHGDEPANTCKVQAILGLTTLPGSCPE